MNGLKYNMKKQPNCVVDVDVKIAGKDLSIPFEEVYRKISKNATFSGFRKGKVPMEMVKKYYKGEAEEKLINKLFPEIIEEIIKKESLTMITTPTVKDYNFEQNNFLKLNISIESQPDMHLKKYKKLKLVQKKYIITKEDVEEVIKNLRIKNAPLKIKDGPADEGDIVSLELQIFRKAKKIKLSESDSIVLEIGKDNILPNLDEKIKGLKKNNKKEFNYTFPENFVIEELKNKEALFKIKIKEIRKREILSEEDIAKMMKYKTVKEFKENIKKDLQKRAELTSQKNMEEQIINILLENHEFEFPQSILNEQIREIYDYTSFYIKQQGGDSSKIDMAVIKKEAEKRVKAGYIFSWISKTEGLDVTEEDKKIEKEKQADNDKIDESAIFMTKVFDFLTKNAKIRTEKVKNGGKK